MKSVQELSKINIAKDNLQKEIERSIEAFNSKYKCNCFVDIYEGSFRLALSFSVVD